MYSKQVETDLCAACQASCACVGETDKALCFSRCNFLFVSPSWGDFGQELFRKACHAFVISRTKGKNWDVTDFSVQSTMNGL